MTSCYQLRMRGGWAEDAWSHRCRFPIAWRNTWSNAAYLVAGLWLLLTQSVPARWPMLAALLVLAVGSALYHGTKEIWANNLDWLGMGATMTVLVIQGLFPRADGLVLGAFSIGAVAALLISKHMHFDVLMGVLFLAAAIPPVVRGELGLTLVSVGLFAVGYLFWQADKHRSWIVGLWGHAGWHVLTAAAMAALFVAQAQ